MALWGYRFSMPQSSPEATASRRNSRGSSSSSTIIERSPDRSDTNIGQLTSYSKMHESVGPFGSVTVTRGRRVVNAHSGFRRFGNYRGRVYYRNTRGRGGSGRGSRVQSSPRAFSFFGEDDLEEYEQPASASTSDEEFMAQTSLERYFHYANRLGVSEFKREILPRMNHPFPAAHTVSDYSISKIPWTSPLRKPSLAKFKWPGAPAASQIFSIPTPIVRYMMENPTNPRVYQKLVAACKILFEMNPVIIVKYLLEYGGINTSPMHYCDIAKINCKIWITESISFIGRRFGDGVARDHLLERLFRCDAKYMIIANDSMTIEELKVYGKNTRDVTVIDYPTTVMLEDFIGAFPNLSRLHGFVGPGLHVSSNTMKSIMDLPSIMHLNVLELYNLSDQFNVEEFVEFMKRYRHVQWLLSFDNNEVPVSQEFQDRVFAASVALDSVVGPVKRCDLWMNYRHGNPILRFSHLCNYYHPRIYCNEDAHIVCWMSGGTTTWKMIGDDV